MSDYEAASRLYIEQSDKELYDSLKQEQLFSGEKVQNKDLFLLAIAYGFEFGKPTPLKNPKAGYIFEHYFKSDDIPLLYALAYFHTNDVQIFGDNNQVMRIAEEYANGGIKILSEEVKSSQYGEYSKILEQKINKKADSINIYI